jgi:hypothetical protein
MSAIDLTTGPDQFTELTDVAHLTRSFILLIIKELTKFEPRLRIFDDYIFRNLYVKLIVIINSLSIIQKFVMNYSGEFYGG